MGSYVGIDLHRQRSVVVVLNEDGKRVSWCRIDNSPANLAREVGAAGPDAEVECVNVNTLLPGRAPPTRPVSFTVASIIASRSSCDDSVPVNNRPALATRFGSSKDTPRRSSACDTRVTESVSCGLGAVDVEDQHRPSPGDLSRGDATDLTPAHR